MKKIKSPRNKFEIKLHRQLKKAKVPFKYESEKIAYYFTGHYIPDFVIDLDGGKVYVEAKGYFRPEHKRKMVAVKKLHPAMDIRIVFYAFRKKDIAWAERHGFPWAISTIPTEWISNELL